MKQRETFHRASAGPGADPDGPQETRVPQGARGAEPLPPESFFQNRACRYFPCHGGIPDERFNCLFCYCPLYALGKGCGGACSYTETGVKDCSACTVPHDGVEGARLVKERFPELAALAREHVGGAAPDGPGTASGEVKPS